MGCRDITKGDHISYVVCGEGWWVVDGKHTSIRYQLGDVFHCGASPSISSVMPFKQQITLRRESQFFSIVVSEVFRSMTTHVD